MGIRLLSSSRALRPLAVLALLWGGPILACGSFQPRPTPTPLPPPTATTQAVQAIAPSPTPPIIIEPTPTAAAEPTATATLPPVADSNLSVGGEARVAAGGGLNIREQPGTNAPIVTRLGFGQRVTITEGPSSVDGYIWWRLDDGQGNVGWGASGSEGEEWISSDVGEALPVNRSPRVGDRVVVTLDGGQLTVRSLPGTASPQISRVAEGSEFTVIAGPQSSDGYIWYQIRSDDGQVEGWAADGDDEERWLSPLE